MESTSGSRTSPELRRQFGVVLQDPFLFTGTIAQNIRLGSDWITDERMKAAADEVNVGDFIRALPLGFDEPLRERGEQSVHWPEAVD